MIAVAPIHLCFGGDCPLSYVKIPTKFDFPTTALSSKVIRQLCHLCVRAYGPGGTFLRCCLTDSQFSIPDLFVLPYANVLAKCGVSCFAFDLL